MPVTPQRFSREPWASIERAAQTQRDPAAFPADIIEAWTATRDADGRPLAGASRYYLHLPLAEATDRTGFWSLSVLDERGDLFTGGGRSSLPSRSADLRRNPDGSIDVVVTAVPPDDPAANWLLAPSGAFRLVFRSFLPSSTAASRPPPIRRRDTAA